MRGEEEIKEELRRGTAAKIQKRTAKWRSMARKSSTVKSVEKLREEMAGCPASYNCTKSCLRRRGCREEKVPDNREMTGIAQRRRRWDLEAQI